jgi:uncharacterized protein (UPF0262 family)
MIGRLCDLVVETAGDRAPPAELEQEQRVAIFDLLEENRFEPVGAPDGPYRLSLGLTGSKLGFSLVTAGGAPAAAFSVSVGPLRQIVKDYTQICRSYYEAVRSKPPAEIEALDEARRAIHHEGAEALSTALDGKARVDAPTARRLFTLVCAMMAGA